MISKPLRFAMVTTFYPPYNFGGDGLFVRRLAHALAGRGHSVDIIHDVDAYNMLSDEAAPREEEPEPGGVRVHRLQSPLGSLSCLATQQLGRPLVHGRQIKRLLDEGFDVIHYHNISLVGGPKILSYGDAIKLYTTHEHWLVCPSHILWRHNREICTGRECVRCVLNHHRLPQIWRATSLLERECRHVDAFLTLSQFCADKHKEFGFERPMQLIPSFLPDSESGPDPFGSPQNETIKPYFLFVGRLEIIKGLQDVIPLFGDAAPAELWIAGSGAYEETLRKMAGDSPNVRFLGQVAPEELRTLYKNAIAVLTPSKCYEVFPMVVLEAFREATPIVARRLGPYPEIIEQSGGGVLFDTAENLKSALDTLAGDRQTRDKMGAAGAHALKTLWSEDVALTRYFDIIAGITESRAGRTALRVAKSRRRVQPIGLGLE